MVKQRQNKLVFICYNFKNTLEGNLVIFFLKDTAYKSLLCLHLSMNRGETHRLERII